MDSGNNIISKNEFLPESVPQEIKAAQDCEYFMVESHKTAYSGEKQVERQIFSKADSALSFFVKGDKGILFKS